MVLREVKHSTNVLTQWSNIEMKPQRRMNETHIEKKAQREENRIDQFQQRNWSEELTNVMALRNATLEQLGYKIKALMTKRSSLSLQKLKVSKQLLGLPNRPKRADQNNSILTYSVLFCITRTPSTQAVKREKADICYSDAKQL